MRPPTRQSELNDLVAAALAWLPVSPKHMDPYLVQSGCTQSVEVVGERGAPVPEGVIQRLPQSFVEPPHLLCTETRRRGARVDASQPASLVGVDVPDAR